MYFSRRKLRSNLTGLILTFVVSVSLFGLLIKHAKCKMTIDLADFVRALCGSIPPVHRSIGA
jgi:hypothetical protein